MPPAQYPTRPNAAFPLEPDGPQHSVLIDRKPEFPGVVVKEMKDGGANIGVHSENPVLRWELVYNFLRIPKAAQLDAHNLSALDTALGFEFRHPRTGILYTDVHYETYEVLEHRKLKIQKRRVVLIKRPTG